MRSRLLVIGGILCLALAWLGPLAHWAADSFAAHMAMHVLVIAVAAPLVAIGIGGSAWDPITCIGSPQVLAGVAVLASALEFVVVWAWHSPGLHHLAVTSLAFRALEQGSYLLVGLAVWLSAFGGRRAFRKQVMPAGMAALLLTSMHMALLGVLLSQAGRPLYHQLMQQPAVLEPLQDQQLGGLIMLIFGGTTYLAGALFLLNQLLTREFPKESGARHAD